MNPSRRSSIRWKLTFAVLGTSGLVLMLSCAAFIWYEVVSFRSDLALGAQTRAAMIAVNSTAALAFDNQEDATEVLAAFRSDPHTVAAALYDRDGAIFARYPPDAADALYPSGLKGARQGFGPNSFDLSLPVLQGNRELGTVYVRSDLGALTERYRVYALLVIGIIASSIALAAVLSHWFDRRLAIPILQLATTARSVSETRDYSLRATRTSNDEIGLLTDSLNDMLAEIQALHVDLEHRVAERTAELAAANQELEAFSYSVSHDLRTPLRGIDGFSHLLLEEYGEKLDEEGRHHLQRVRAGARRMSELIDDLLRLAHISKVALRRERVDLSRLARDIAEDLRSASPERIVSLHIEADLVTPGDRQLLRVALENLLGNAWKYTRKRSHAEIRLGRRSSNGSLAFFVQDNGVGFDMAHSAKLFGAFQRLHRPDEFEGTGIGLATVHRIVRRHSGQIWAESTVDQGSTFFFTLKDDGSGT